MQPNELAELHILRMEVDLLSKRNVELQRQITRLPASPLEEKAVFEVVRTALEDGTAAVVKVANALSPGAERKWIAICSAARRKEAKVETKLEANLEALRRATSHLKHVVDVKVEAMAELLVAAAQSNDIVAKQAVVDSLRVDGEKLRDELAFEREAAKRTRAQYRLLLQKCESMESQLQMLRLNAYLDPCFAASEGTKPKNTEELVAMVHRLTAENVALRQTLARLSQE